MEVTLAKALKIKKRLTNKIADITSRISSQNCIVKEGIRNENVQELIDNMVKCTHALIDLKMVIFSANKDIQRKIFTISENKGYISLLIGLDTREGKKVSEGRWAMSQETVEYASQISYQDVQKQIGILQKQIDATQDEIDQYNHTTKVEIDSGIEDLI